MPGQGCQHTIFSEFLTGRLGDRAEECVAEARHPYSPLRAWCCKTHDTPRHTLFCVILTGDQNVRVQPLLLVCFNLFLLRSFPSRCFVLCLAVLAVSWRWLLICCVPRRCVSFSSEKKLKDTMERREEKANGANQRRRLVPTTAPVSAIIIQPKPANHPGSGIPLSDTVDVQLHPQHCPHRIPHTS